MRVCKTLILFVFTLALGMTASNLSGEAWAQGPAGKAGTLENSTRSAQRDIDKRAQTDTDQGQNKKGKKARGERRAERRQKMAQLCPMRVEGTTPEAVKLEGAVAIDFKTTGDVAELRQRGQKMAKMHAKMHNRKNEKKHSKKHADQKGRHHQMRERHDGKHAEQREMHQQMMQLMSGATVESEAIEGGMRMKFTPSDPAQIDTLYKALQTHVEMVKERGGCPMAM